MSLWYESLGLCLDDCGDDAVERARCILAHLSMDVPRSWWEHALQAGSVPKSYANILQDLHEELLKTAEFTEGIGFGLLVALAFADDDIDQQLPKFGTVYWECSVEQYLAKAKEILAKRPELGRLGQAIDKRKKYFKPVYKVAGKDADSRGSLKGKREGDKAAKKDVTFKGKSKADKLTEMLERGDFDDLIEKELACEIRLTLSAEDRKFFDKEEGLTKEDIAFFKKLRESKKMSFDTLKMDNPLFVELKEKQPAWWQNLKNDNDINIEIRKDNYIDVYYHGGTIIKELRYDNKTSSFTGKIHFEYIPLVSADDKEKYIPYVFKQDTISIDTNRIKPITLNNFNPKDDLKRIKKRISHFMDKAVAKDKSSEKSIQGQFIKNDPYYIDMEFAYDKQRIDLVRIDVENKIIVFVEVKTTADPRLFASDIVKQLEGYSEFIKDNKDDLLKYYKNVFKIKKNLEILPKGLSGIGSLDKYEICEKPLLLFGDCDQKWIVKNHKAIESKIQNVAIGCYYFGKPGYSAAIINETKGNRHIFKKT